MRLERPSARIRMLPDIAIRNLRQAAWILRGTELWQDAGVDELRRMALRLDEIADAVEDRALELPAASCG
jgi:hypothetical protein